MQGYGYCEEIGNLMQLLQCRSEDSDILNHVFYSKVSFS